MRHYNVSFFKDLLSSDGHRFKCAQGVIAVDADAPAEAMDAAKQEFDRRIGDWRLYSDTVEIKETTTLPLLIEAHRDSSSPTL